MIGVAERVDLPEWGVTRMRAKIDTGARTSALHVDGIEEIGDDRVRFAVVQHKDEHDERVVVEAPVVRRGRVRSSTGRVQERIYVATRISIGGVEKSVEISLASRKRMIFRMLLGRTALGEDFIVDPSRRYVCSRRKRRTKRKTKRAAKRTTARRHTTKKKRRKKTTKKKTAKKKTAKKKTAKKKTAKKKTAKKKTAKKKTAKKKTAKKKTAKKKMSGAIPKKRKSAKKKRGPR